MRSNGVVELESARTIATDSDQTEAGIVVGANKTQDDVASNGGSHSNYNEAVLSKGPTDSVTAAINDRDQCDDHPQELHQSTRKTISTNCTPNASETWEDRIQREIELAKQSIEKILHLDKNTIPLQNIESTPTCNNIDDKSIVELAIVQENQAVLPIELMQGPDSLPHHRQLTAALDDSRSIDVNNNSFDPNVAASFQPQNIPVPNLCSYTNQEPPAMNETLLHSPSPSPIPTFVLPPVSPSTPDDVTSNDEVKQEFGDNIRQLADSYEINKSHRRRHLVVENDDYGEGLNVITIDKSSYSSSTSLHQFTREHRRHSGSFNNSLLDDDQNIGPERRRAFKNFVSEQLEPYDDDDILHRSVDTHKSVGSTNPLSAESISKLNSVDVENLTALEEKKEHDVSILRCASSADLHHDRNATFTPATPYRRPNEDEIDPELQECLSATESEVASLDGLPSTLQSQLLDLGTSPRDRILQTLDGVFSLPNMQKKKMELAATEIHDNETTTATDEYIEPPNRSYGSNKTRANRVVIGGGKIMQKQTNDDDSVNENSATCGGIFLDTCVNNFTGLWNGSVMDDDRLKCGSKGQWNATSMKQKLEVPLAILDCSNIINQEDRIPPYAARVHSSFVRVARNSINVPYGESILPVEADPRMQDWIANQYINREKPPSDGTYQLGQSRTVVIHEINRGNWTWCTAWSPDGTNLAVATDNHQLAVIDTSSSTVWRVRHDRKLKPTSSNNSIRSIRCIDWGSNFIAIGGTGNTVSILSSCEPYSVLHDIHSTGFVGSVHWRGDSNVLAIGSRLDFVLVVRIVMNAGKRQGDFDVYSEILHKIEYKYWVNCVKFSPDGSCIAVGDAGGIVSIYDYEEAAEKVETHMITWFKRKESILCIEWSPDGKWLYAGGEDCSVTVVDTAYWEIVHRIGQDRWVQCIASSHGGSHVAIGGVSSEISLLDVDNGWDSVMGIELKGLVPLSAKWHPRDQYLVLTGQDNSILAVETTNARHVKGHHLHSVSPIRAIEFSPDGRMAVVGNETGIVTFFSLSGTSFITSYELVIPLSRSVSIRWSLNGTFVVVGSANSVIIVSRKRKKRQGQKCPPNASGFSVKKVIGDLGSVHAITIDYQSRFVAISGDCTSILDVRDDFSTVQEWKNGPCYANNWSPDGRWLAMMGKDKFLTIYDTSAGTVDQWNIIFSMKCDFIGRAVTWGPLIIGGLLYLAYGGESNEIYIMEIRTYEGTWETVLKVKRDACINALDWNIEGLLAAGVGNGTVCVIDLAYLQSGVAVNEMDYEWQRQALTCFTEVRRNRGVNSIKSLRWLPAAPGSDRLLAVGGTDGEVEIIDLTERQRCKGYSH